MDAGFVSSEGDEHSDAVTPGGTRFGSSVLISQSFFFWVDDEEDEDEWEGDFG